MAAATSDTRQPLRLWPGVVAVVLQWALWESAPLVIPGAAGAYTAAIGLLLTGLAVVVWWAFFSRAPWPDRWAAIGLMIVGLAITPLFLHESVTKGNMGAQFFLYGIPVLCLAFVVWAVLTRRLADRPRRVTMAVTILLACGAWTLLRNKGLTGDGEPIFAWRWSETAEERLLARAEEPVKPLPATAAVLTGGHWPGFRGADRTGVVRGVGIETDWDASPPIEIWRRLVGPGVSSFAVRGELLYTQEQRGEEEVLAAYRVSTGEPVWKHHEKSRFWDSHVGAGPRATPAVGKGRVYALGARGTLIAVDAETGALLWSRDLAADNDASVPTFGFTSSPMVVDDQVVVTAGRLAAYDVFTGEPRWLGPSRSGSYSSPQLMTIDEVSQIVLLNSSGVLSVKPENGTLLWRHPLPAGYVQPVSTASGDLVISLVDDATAAPLGTSLVSVSSESGGWSIEERWRSDRLKPSFSPVVVHRGHAYGFDRRILACIDLEDGGREWKGGRYGSGQLLLLPDQDLLLVVSEQGDLALVRAVPDQFTELGRFDGIEGRTWNQPALVGDVLLVRNGREMAAFRLPSESADE